MKNLKFFTLFRTLTEKEVPAFHKYLKQMHGGEEIAMRVFDYARKFYPDFANKKKLHPAYAYHKIFGFVLPEEEKERKKLLKNMLNALSDLHLWLKDFLIAEKIADDSLESQAIWLGILQERELKAEFAKQATRMYAETKAVSQKGANSYLLEMVASYFHCQHLSLVRPIPDLDALQQCLDTWEMCAETIRLKMACLMINLKNMAPSLEKGVPMPLQPLEWPEMQRLKSSALLLLYWHIYQLIVTGEKDHYNYVEAALIESADQLSLDEVHGIISYLHNYAAVQIRSGEETIFKKKVHQLNKLGLEHGIFSQKGIMSSTQFTNIVSTACTVNDFDWAKSFITAHSGYLLNDIREDTVRLAQAIMCFEEKNFHKVLQLLGSTEFRDIHYIIRARLLILRSYIDLKEDLDTILDYCAAFSAQLKRNRKSEAGAVDAALESVRVIKMLLAKRVEKQVLIKQIDKSPHLYYKDWLIEQANNYKPL